MERFAIYYSPSLDSSLSREAALWLGRDNQSQSFQNQKNVAGLSCERLREITASPFHYGFHATIKPPFSLASGMCVNRLKERLADFTAKHCSFRLPPLQVNAMHNFFCLRLTRSCRSLHDLAGKVVREFDDLRRPDTEAEIARRKNSAELSEIQKKMLRSWGYPYVMDEFRFHMTLTGPVVCQMERAIIVRELKQRFDDTLLDAVAFDNLSLFHEINRKPMQLIAAYPLAPERKEERI